jgi:hypothetical protein
MTARVPFLTANGRRGLEEGTFATTRGKARDAPLTAIRGTALEPPESTLSRQSGPRQPMGGSPESGHSRHVRGGRRFELAIGFG